MFMVRDGMSSLQMVATGLSTHINRDVTSSSLTEALSMEFINHQKGT